MKPLFLFVGLLLAVPVWAQTKTVVRVLDSQGAPVVGASVAVIVWENRATPIPPQTTDPNGAVTFDLPASTTGKPVGGRVSVVALGFGFNGAALSGQNLEIRLEAGATWRGKVTGEAGKPIEGATVKVTGAAAGNDWRSYIHLIGEKNTAAYTFKTGADGGFAIRDVPAKMGLTFSVEHPDYAVKNGNGVLAGAEAIFQLAPGGSVRGRVLDVAGKPLAFAAVYASQSRFGGGNVGQSDADGNFVIKSLAAGVYEIAVHRQTTDPEIDFVLPRATGVSVIAGKTSEVPEMRGVAGFEIQGIVRDAATKKPLAGASIIAEQENDTSASDISKADGKFSLRVLAGRYKVYVSGPTAGYTRPNFQDSVEVGPATKNEKKVVFDLKKAMVLRGTIVDEAGKPLQAKLKIGYDSSLESDAAGKWQLEVRDENSLQLAGGDAEDGYFEVVSPQVIQLGARGEIAIVLRKKPWQVLPGRALTSAGKPLEGVQIEGTFSTPMGEVGQLQSSTRTAVSNANGDFVLPQIRDGIQANSNFFQIKGKKDGFAFQKGGELSKNGPVWQVSDFIFTPLDLTIEGQTAPLARVTIAGMETIAGADGKFKIEGLPASEGKVWAFLGADFGGAAAQSPVQIELKKQGLQARDAELARDIWNDILLEAQRGTKGQSYNVSGIERLMATSENLDFAARLAKTNSDGAISQLVERFATKLDLAALEPALARITDADRRVYTYLIAAAKSDDKPLAARALQEAETNFQTPAKEIWWRETNLYRAAAVAANFNGEAAGFAALDRAVAFTLKNHGVKSTRQNNGDGQAGQSEMMAMAAEIVAAGGPTLFQRLLRNIEPESGYDVTALSQAIPVLAKNGVESVLPLLDELEKMPEPRTREETQRADQSPQWAFAVAASKIVPLLGVVSPQKALDLARRVRDENYGNSKKWSALAGAAKFQSGESATQLWREIVSGAGAESASRYAARAFEFDPQLGRDLFQVALQKVEVESKNEWQGRELWASYAFYSARAGAAPARFLLEREWGAARQKKTEGDQLGALALAMAAIDGPRAWQMAREIPADNFFASFDTRRKIGLYLNASQEKRRDFPLGRQDNWEEWREIEEE